MAYVIKIKYGDSLRRLTFRKEELSDKDLSFDNIETKIRELFEVPATTKLSVTYSDADNDVVTMANDQDLLDALVHQSLNPLRLYVKDVSSNVPFKQLLRKLSASSDSVKKVVQSYEPMFEGVSSPAQAAGLVENILRNVTSQLTTAVKHGADAAARKPLGSGVSPSSRAADTTCRSSDSFNTAAAKAARFGDVLKENAGVCRSSDAFNAAAGKNPGGVETKEDGPEHVHIGVSCDVCGVRPIRGLRWKSNKKYDFDLCSSCFAKHGNEHDYTNVDRGMMMMRHRGHGPNRMGQHFYPMGLSQSSSRGRSFSRDHSGPFGPFGRHQCGATMGVGFGGGKLDARFVTDVTVFDGTEVAPGTHFTKIWRLRNSGSISWPLHTNLVHVGGDDLGQVAAVPLQLVSGGLAPDGETDVAVDLIAPARPGRYISHWRLASPSGPKFGHRIWVAIQVVPTTIFGDFQEEMLTGLDLPPQSVEEQVPSQLEPTKIFVNEEGADESAEEMAVIGGQLPDEELLGNGWIVHNPSLNLGLHLPTDTPVELTRTEIESVVPSSGADNSTDIEVGKLVSFSVPVDANVPEMVDVDDEKAVNKTFSPPVENSETVEGRISYPVLEVTPGEEPITYPQVDAWPVEVIDITPEVPVVEGKVPSPQALLGKLEAMGFTNSKLNLELLEKNNFELRKTLDDLCVVEEWDPMLEELEEMGFFDLDMNRRLMFKNNGSVKRVVKDLVQMYRGSQE